jgi:hypothetical protein
MRSYNVRLGDKVIDTVFNDAVGKNRAERESDVKRGLVNHDGYDPAIKVTECGATHGSGVPKYVPGTRVTFGKEKTKAQQLARARWERQQAEEVCGKECGDILTVMHMNTAEAYEAIARKS